MKNSNEPQGLTIDERTNGKVRARGYFRRAWADAAAMEAFAKEPTAAIASDDRFAAMAKAAERFGLTLVAEDTRADIGCAARTNPLEERPSLLHLVEEAESGAYGVLVVHRVVDLSRVCSQVVEILSRLRGAGVRVIAVDGRARWLDHLDSAEKVRASFVEKSAAQRGMIGRERLREIRSANAKRRAAARG